MKKLDIFDALIALGCLMVVVGIWLLSPPAAVIIGGGLLIAAGVLGAAQKGRTAQGGNN